MFFDLLYNRHCNYSKLLGESAMSNLILHDKHTAPIESAPLLEVARIGGIRRCWSTIRLVKEGLRCTDRGQSNL